MKGRKKKLSDCFYRFLPDSGLLLIAVDLTWPTIVITTVNNDRKRSRGENRRQQGGERWIGINRKKRPFLLMGSPSKLTDFYLGIQTFFRCFVDMGENHYATISPLCTHCSVCPSVRNFLFGESWLSTLFGQWRFRGTCLRFLPTHWSYSTRRRTPFLFKVKILPVLRFVLNHVEYCIEGRSQQTRRGSLLTC